MSPEKHQSTGIDNYSKQKPSEAMSECLKAGQMKPRTKSYTHYLVVGGLGASWLAYFLYSKRRGTWTSLGEDAQELKDAVTTDYQAYVERKHAKQEQREQERIEREQQQAEQPVYDYPETYAEPTYTEPAPKSSNDDDGWGL